MKQKNYTQREKLVLSACAIPESDSNIIIDYHSPFVGRQSKNGQKWEEIKLNEQGTKIENPKICQYGQLGSQLWFRRSTLGHAWRAYIKKDN